tara:strand:+ start:234 stop:611 length:378 start_codon:yes stop_codon:yes gene_type:complete
MKKFTREINFKDKRGYILDISYKEDFNHSTLISSNKNSVRANHYHKKTTQISFILNGSCFYFSKKLNQKKTKKIKLKKFDYLITRPNEIHAYKFLEKTEMIVFSKGLRGGKDYEKDTFRVQKKLI